MTNDVHKTKLLPQPALWTCSSLLASLGLSFPFIRWRMASWLPDHVICGRSGDWEGRRAREHSRGAAKWSVCLGVRAPSTSGWEGRGCVGPSTHLNSPLTKGGPECECAGSGVRSDIFLSTFMAHQSKGWQTKHWAENTLTKNNNENQKQDSQCPSMWISDKPWIPVQD